MTRFDKVYASTADYFGAQPSQHLIEFLARMGLEGGRALDLGCGQGRNAIFLARSGFSVVAIDKSSNGLRQLTQVTQQFHLDIQCIHQDVVTYHFPNETFDLVIAVTVLDHLASHHIPMVAQGILRTLVKGGVGCISVFTTRDPGYSVESGKQSTDATDGRSECADAIQHYFEPGELDSLFQDTEIIRSIEETELDTKHGPIHYHGIARLFFRK